MKNFIAAFAVTAFTLAGCSDQSASESTTNNAAPASPATSSLASTASSSDIGQRGANGMPKLAEELNCVACHRIDVKLVGPAWQDVSAKYKGATTYKYSKEGSAASDAKEYPLVEGLVKKVSTGGKGNWGTMPMPANDPSGAKKEKIEQLVKFVLGLAK